MKINVGVLGGNLVRDPELKYTPSGTAICEFTIANSEKYKKGEELVEETGFYNCICWGKRGETIKKYFEKGKPILVTYRLKFQQWETQEGQKRSAVKLNVTDFDFAGFKADGGQAGSTTTPAQDSQQKLDINDDEIPF